MSPVPDELGGVEGTVVHPAVLDPAAHPEGRAGGDAAADRSEMMTGEGGGQTGVHRLSVAEEKRGGGTESEGQIREWLSRSEVLYLLISRGGGRRGERGDRDAKEK